MQCSWLVLRSYHLTVVQTNHLLLAVSRRQWSQTNHLQMALKTQKGLQCWLKLTSRVTNEDSTITVTQSLSAYNKKIRDPIKNNKILYHATYLQMQWRPLLWSCYQTIHQVSLVQIHHQTLKTLRN